MDNPDPIVDALQRLRAALSGDPGPTVPRTTLRRREWLPLALELYEAGIGQEEIVSEIGLPGVQSLTTAFRGNKTRRPVATPDERERYIAQTEARSPQHKARRIYRDVGKPHIQDSGFRTALQGLLDEPTSREQFRHRLLRLLTSASRHRPEPIQHAEDVPIRPWEGPPPRRVGAPSGVEHPRAIRVITPKGSFVSITAAAQAHGITKETAWHRVRTSRHGDWRVEDDRS